MVALHILITVAFYCVLMWLSINLVGFFVRGLFSHPVLEELKVTGSDFVKEEIGRSNRADWWLNIIALLLIGTYLFLAFYFWNIGVALIALVLMITRLPDLIWEIKTGVRVTRSVAMLMPKNGLYFLMLAIDLISLPALYYFLYYY